MIFGVTFDVVLQALQRRQDAACCQTYAVVMREISCTSISLVPRQFKFTILDLVEAIFEFACMLVCVNFNFSGRIVGLAPWHFAIWF